MVSGGVFMGVGYWLSTPKANRPNLALSTQESIALATLKEA